MTPQQLVLFGAPLQGQPPQERSAEVPTHHEGKRPGSSSGRLMLKELPTAEQPRERLEKYGPSALATSELIEVVIHSNHSLGREVLARCESLRRLWNMPTAELAEIPGINTESVQLIIAEIGLDMTRFPTAAHLVSWAKLCPRTIQSGAKNHTGKAGKGNPYLKGALGMAAATAARGKDTFLSERYRRVVKRRGKGKALVAVARSILVIIWHLLADPTTRFHDLGADFHDRRVNTTRKISSLVRQLEALGHTVTLQPAA